MQGRPFVGRATVVLTVALLLVALLLVACVPLTSVNQGSRLGLLAPFEGLYRRSGYNSLAAVRSTLDAHAATTGAADPWLPVALDTSRDPERAARKLLAPGNASALIGPLTPSEAARTYPALRGVDIRWLAPFAQVRGVPVAVDDPAWLAALIAQVSSSVADEDRVSRIAIAGSGPLFAIIDQSAVADLLGAGGALPVAWIDAQQEVGEGDLLLWLGEAAEGVRFVAQVRANRPTTPVWLPIWAAGDVFAEHAAAQPGWQWQGIEWGGWLPHRAQEDAPLTPVLAEALQLANLAQRAVADEGRSIEEWEFVSLPLQPE